jgi:tRNA-binding protein
MIISYEDFAKVELHSGTVIKAEAFPEARKPALKVWVDFGPELGVKQTSAQITHYYTPEKLAGKSVIGCVNLGTKHMRDLFQNFSRRFF